MLRRYLSIFILVAIIPAASIFAQEIGPKALEQIAALAAEKSSRTPAEQKISSALLLEHKRRAGDPAVAALSHLRLGSGVDAAGSVLVDLDAKVTVALLAAVEQLGGTVISSHARFEAVRAHLPLAAVVELAALEHVRSIRPADRYLSQGTGAVVTEGDVAHGADAARTNFGIDGSGVSVGAMSDSVDELANLQAAGELPPGVTVLAGQSGNPGTSEGTALLEIIHDMAPGADLFFATGSGGQAQMAQNILDLQAAGCDVIVDDVLYFAEPVFQDGVIAQAVDTVAAAGTFYFSSAGNSGNLNDGTSGVHEGQYSGTTLPTPLVGVYMSAHDFDGAGANNATLTVDTPFFITLQWSNPQDAASDDYDLFLLDAALANVISASTNVQNGTQDPFEFIDSTASDDAGRRIVVTKFAGDDAFIHVNTHRGQIEHGTDGQIFGHPAALGALAVAAINVATAGGGQFTGGVGVQVETFSSDGPRRIFFNADGSPVAAQAPGPVKGIPQSSIVRDKPDVTAADGVSTATPGFTTFFGTSASAPHTAALAALYEELFPTVSVPSAFDIFRSTALDIEDEGFDRDSGNGILMIQQPSAQTIFADGFESGDAAAWTDSAP